MAIRTTSADMQSEAIAALARALEGTGVAIEGRHPFTLALPDGRAVACDINAWAVVDAARASEVVRRGQLPIIVVADLITAEARTVLDSAGVGWLDRRGHLRVYAPGLFIDRDVDPVPRLAQRGHEAVTIRGAAAIGVAAAHLIGLPASVRHLATTVRLSPAAVSKARNNLARAGLLDDGPDARRALFWLLASAWRPAWVELPGPPPLGADLVAGGSRAAAALGAPVIVTADYPVELYATDVESLERARLLIRPNRSSRPRARLAVAPTALVGSPREGPEVRVQGWSVAHPLFVGLDLAADPARGQEVLQSWDPPGWARAW